jgi:hypothetical protein
VDGDHDLDQKAYSRMHRRVSKVAQAV